MQATKRPPIRAVARVRRCGRALFTPASARRTLRPVAALLVLIAVLAPASLRASFTAPVELSGDGAFEPQVALDSDGDALVVWKGSDGSFFRIQARARSAAGVLGPAQTLSGAGRNALLPHVAVDGDGDGVAVWRRRDGTGPCSNFGCFRIQARARAAAGTLASVQTLSPPGQDADHPQIVIDTDGDALVVWERNDGIGPCSSQGCILVQARSRSAAGTLGAVQTLSPAGPPNGAVAPEVAVDADGDALVVWRRADSTTDCGGFGCFRIQARARSAAGILGPVLTLSPAGEDASDAQVAIDAEGDALTVWNRFDGTGPCSSDGCLRIQARARSATGTLGPVQGLSATGRNGVLPQVAIDADGDALVVWRRLDDSAIQARTRSAAGVLGPVQTLSPAGGNSIGPVAMDSDGDAVAVWTRDGKIQARTRSAAGAFGPVQTLSAAGAGEAKIAVDSAGDALAVWRFGPPEGGGCCARVQAAAGP